MDLKQQVKNLYNIKNFFYRFDSDNLEELTNKITMDYEVTDSFAIGVIWNNDGTKISQLYHIPIQSLRYDKNYYNKNLS